MLVFTGRLTLFLSLLALRIVESLLSLTIRLILLSMSFAQKKLCLLMINIQSSFLEQKSESVQIHYKLK